MDNYLTRVKTQRQEELKDKEKAKLHSELITSVEKQTQTLVKATQPLSTSKDSLAVKNAVIDVNTQALLAVSALNSIKDSSTKLVELTKLGASNTTEKTIILHQEKLASALSELKNVLEKEPKPVKIEQERETAKQLKEIKQLFKKIELNPVINVEASQVDTTGLDKAVDKLPQELAKELSKRLEKALKGIPTPTFSTEEITKALEANDKSVVDLLTQILNKPVPVPEFPLTMSVTPTKTRESATSGSVSVGSSSTTVVASNDSRKAVVIVNDSDEVVYLKYGTGATANSGIRLNANGGLVREEMYTGIITAICASGSKNITVTEI